MCSSCGQPKETSSVTNEELKKLTGKSNSDACHASGDGKESEQVTATSMTCYNSDADAPLFLIEQEAPEIHPAMSAKPKRRGATKLKHQFWWKERRRNPGFRKLEGPVLSLSSGFAQPV